MTAWDRVDIDFNAEAVSLEEEAWAVCSRSFEGGGQPRAISYRLSLPAPYRKRIRRAPGVGAEPGIVVTGGRLSSG